MKVGSIVKNAGSLGMLAAVGTFVSLRIVLGLNTFLSMIVGLVVGLGFAFICEKSRRKK